jgi:hypothetical protein
VYDLLPDLAALLALSVSKCRFSTQHMEREEEEWRTMMAVSLQTSVSSSSYVHVHVL